LGIGDWGLGIGDWGLGPIPNPQSPIPILSPKNLKPSTDPNGGSKSKQNKKKIKK
jgi:hypothetical protein